MRRFAALAEHREKADREGCILAKQSIVVQCRAEQRSLLKASQNLTGVGKKLDVVISFLGDLQDQLTTANERLDALQLATANLCTEMRRLLGKPAHQVFSEFYGHLREQASHLRDHPYVEQWGLRRGCTDAGEPFKESETNRRFPLMKAVESFLRDAPDRHRRQQRQRDDVEGAHDTGHTENPRNAPHPQVLLLSGVAGAGKSMFAKELLHRMAFGWEEEADGAWVALIVCNLPAMQLPMTNLFDEALRSPPYNMRDAQIAEFREDIQKSGPRIAVVFLFDGYDELRPEFKGRNLYQTNNLDQYRSQEAPNCFPKVIVCCRWEELAGWPDYQRSFVPLEMRHNNKDERHEVDPFLVEYQLASFDRQQRDTYIYHDIALKARDMYKARFGALPVVRRGLGSGEELLKKVLQDRQSTGAVLRKETEGKRVGSGELLKGQDAQLGAVLTMTTVLGNEQDGEILQQHISEYLDRTSHCAGAHPHLHVANPIAAMHNFALQKNDLTVASDVSFALCQALDAANGWAFCHFEDALKDLTELEQLLSTPFMVGIVVKILPVLVARTASSASVKQELILLTGEDTANEAFAQMLNEHLVSSGRALQNTQQLVAGRGPHPDAHKYEWVDSKDKLDEVLQKICVNVTSRKAPGRPAADAEARASAGAQVEVEQGARADAAAVARHARVACADTGQDLMSALRTVLRRKVLRRYVIYDMFMNDYVDRAVSKLAAVGGSAVMPDTLRALALEYSAQLAVKMTEQDMTKVNYKPAPGAFFGESDEWAVFFRDGDEQVALARHAAPLRFSHDVVSFMHKSIQEFNVAHAIVTAINNIRKNTLMTPADLQKLCPPVWAPGGDSNSSATQDTPLSLRDHTKLQTVRRQLTQSALGRVEIGCHEAIRDFVVDVLLDDLSFANNLKAVFYFCARHNDCRDVPGRLCRENVKALVTGGLPRRNGGTALHAAAAEGNVWVLDIVLVIALWFDRSSSPDASNPDVKGVLDTCTDRRGRTALFVAAEAGQREMCAYLLKLGADPAIGADAVLRLRQMYGQSKVDIDMAQSTIKIGGTRYWGNAINSMEEMRKRKGDLAVVGAPLNNRVTRGRWRFEVEFPPPGPQMALQRRPHGEEGEVGRWVSDWWWRECTVGWAVNVGVPSDAPLVGRSAKSIGIGIDGRVRFRDWLWSKAREPATEQLGILNAALEDAWKRPPGEIGPPMLLSNYVHQMVNKWRSNSASLSSLLDAEDFPAVDEFTMEQEREAMLPAALHCCSAVIGVAVDLDAGELYFGGDEGWHKVEDKHIRDSDRDTLRVKDFFDDNAGVSLHGIVPVISGVACGGTVKVNFGEQPWKIEADPVKGAPFRPFCKAPKAHAIHAAAAAGFVDVALLEGLQWDKRGFERLVGTTGRCLLHHAAYFGDLEFARHLLDQGVDVNVKDQYDQTPVYHALSQGHTDIIRMLACQKGFEYPCISGRRVPPCYLLPSPKATDESGPQVCTRAVAGMSHGHVTPTTGNQVECCCRSPCTALHDPRSAPHRPLVAAAFASHPQLMGSGSSENARSLVKRLVHYRMHFKFCTAVVFWPHLFFQEF